jgi:urocanate hydratase
VLAAGEGAAASGFAAAASLAGAASLTMDDDAESVKTHFRDGAFDFVVNTLDEALRAIKNEVRQRRPIAIALVGTPDAVLREAAERGLAPALTVAAGDSRAAVTALAPQVLSLDEAASAELAAWLRERGWKTDSVKREAATAIANDDVRGRWVRGLAAHQRSSRGGDVWMWIADSER